MWEEDEAERGLYNSVVSVAVAGLLRLASWVVSLELNSCERTVAKRKKEKAARESSTVVVKLLGSMFAR